ncbi:hypothetical protein [Mitsuaria sp. 7]|uniref:hypothetical protein n=1 Tax=Mitsuaria sp. 7 TaxID=1658665 RepID=UPI0012F72135|nr:hypothetical protein [Mitsuaria sp. 7]
MKLNYSFLALIGLAAAIAGCSKSNADYEVLAGQKIQCPEGSHLEYLPWGESGLEATCLQRHGPSVVSEHGQIKIQGQYSRDKQEGEWRWLDASGKVVRTERYGVH